MFVDIALYIQIGKISQYLAAQDESNKYCFQGGSLTPSLSRLIYIVRTQIQTEFARNSTDQSLNSTALYLYALCGKYAARAKNIINAIAGGVPLIITQPANQSVVVGNSATFTVAVTSASPVTYQWFLNGVAIPGATSSFYTFTNAQLTDSGDGFYVQVTNAVGSVSSNVATLTVSSALTGGLFYTDTDPFPTLNGGSDPFSYQISFPITHNSPFVITLTSAAGANHYLVVKAASTEPVKTIWNNTPFNNGTIPDSVWRPYLTFGGNDYYVTYNQTPMDYTSALTLS